MRISEIQYRLFDKYKDTEEFGDTPFGYTGQI
jgi:hypothetical protein